MRVFYIVFILLGMLAACNKPQSPVLPQTPQTQSSASEEEVLALVEEDPITPQQVSFRLQQLDQEDANFAQSQTGQRHFLQLLIREKLASLDARDKQLDKSDEYTRALADKRAQLQEIYQQYAEQLLLHLWEDQLRQTGVLNISDEEIAAYHKKYPYEMTIKQLILDDAQTAEEIWRQVKSSKSRWKELENRYSVAPQQSKGKEISFMPGEFIPELEVIAANSAVGSVQGFVKTAQGFHIIMKTKERRLSLQEAAPRIRSVLEQQKMDALLQDLQTKYKVIIYEQHN